VKKGRNREPSVPIRREIEKKVAELEPIVLKDEELKAQRSRRPRELPAYMETLAITIGSASHRARMDELSRRWVESENGTRRQATSARGG
jgi:hypothetical protein